MPKIEKNCEIDGIRKEIADKTFHIIRLCGERFELARKISVLKLEERKSIENPIIEEKLKKQALKECRECGVDENFCLNLMNLLIKESKRIQTAEINSLEKARRSSE